MRTAWKLGTGALAMASVLACASPSAAATWQSQSSGTPNTLFAVSCATTSTCVTVGGAGTIRTTNDGGGTWTARTSGTTSAVYGVSCPTSAVCIAVGDGGTIRASTDGGASWGARTSGTNFALNAVSCATATACTAVGIHGTIVTTTNGGSTWVQHDLGGPPENLWGVSCSTASSCVVVGDKGKIFATTDGGATWSSQSSGVGNWLGGVSCPSASVCTAVGYGGGIFTTANGGATWTARSAGTTNDFEAVTCPTISTCVAVGQGGTIRATANGGGSWSIESSGTAAKLWGVACPAAGTCYAVGDGGVIRVTKQAGGGTWEADATGPLNLAFHANGTLPIFPCPQGGCSVSFAGQARGGGTLQASSGGVQYNATFALANAVLTSTAGYTEPDMPFCPAAGFAAGTATVGGAATGLVRTSNATTASGSVWSVRLELSYTYDRTATGAVIAVTGGTATVVFSQPNNGGKGVFTSAVTGRGAAAFVADPVALAEACEAPRSLPFTVVGDAALALTPEPVGADAAQSSESGSESDRGPRS